MSDPSEVFLKAFTSVQQGEKLEEDGKLRPALAKYRFAASLLEQLTQTNPSWQPLIVKYRVRKTTENIQKLEDKLSLQPQSDQGNDTSTPAPPPGQGLGSYAVPNNYPAPAGPVATTPRSSGSDDDLPVPDDAASMPGVDRSGANYAVVPPPDYTNRAAADLGKRLDKAQRALKAAVDARDAAVKEKQDTLKKQQELEFQLHSVTTGSRTAQARFEKVKADRDDLQGQVDKLDARMKESKGKNGEAPESSKELRAQIAELKKSLTKADADTAAAAKERDDMTAKYTTSEAKNGKLAKERDDAQTKVDLTSNAAEKIQALQTQNDDLTQKLSTAEASIAQLTAESVKKKEELAGLQTELTSLKGQLVTSRDQNDKSATTITELRKQLDDGARHLEELKSKGSTSEDLARMTQENDILRGVVMRQLKDQARRMQARDLLNDELKRLEVQSDTLNKQVEELGRPTMQLTDQERALFKDPQVTISDSDNNPASVAVVISGVKARAPGASPTANPAGDLPGPSPAPDATAKSGASPAPAAPGAAAAPKVETQFQPPVADDLKPIARTAKDNFDRGKYADAERDYEKLLARDPKNPYLLANQGVVLFHEDKIKSAEVTLKKALAASPKDPFCMSTLGIVYYKMHRYDDAISFLTQAIQLDPKNATAHNYLGITSSQKGWPEEALEELTKAIQLNPNYADAHFNLAVVYATYSPPSFDRAQEHYKLAIALGAAPDPTLEKLIKPPLSASAGR